MKRIAAMLLIIAALITGAGCTQGDAKYQYVFFDVFDTVTELTVYAASETAAAYLDVVVVVGAAVAADFELEVEDAGNGVNDGR